MSSKILPHELLNPEGVDFSKANKTLLEASGSRRLGKPQEWIGKRIANSESSLVARFGSTELSAALSILRINSTGLRQRVSHTVLTALAHRKIEPIVWSQLWFRRLSTKSGFFPISEEAVLRYAECLLSSMEQIDLLGSWVAGEAAFRGWMPRALVTSLDGISPFGKATPWTSALSGKRVLVVHPFKDTIEKQFGQKSSLFQDPDFLPDFELRVLKAVQSLGEPPKEWSSWFDALDYMEKEALKEPFDVAILGCGSYGLPLGGRLRAAGGVVIVLGGLTQLLFGIRGSRWEGSGLYNEHWVRPSEREKPAGFKGADGGAYW